MINYKRISENVNIIDVAERYGVTVNGRNKSICPFHSEKTASLSYHNNRFKCFGCGASGDVIDFAAKLFNISFAESAAKLNTEFRLGYDLKSGDTQAVVSDYLIKQRRKKAFKEYELQLFIDLCDERHRLNDIIRSYHGNPEDAPPKEFTDALGKIGIMDYYINVLTVSPEDAKITWLAENRKDVERIAGR